MGIRVRVIDQTMWDRKEHFAFFLALGVCLYRTLLLKLT